MPQALVSASVSDRPSITVTPVTGQPPEEILRTLERFNIEWNISDEGHLMIRTWQVVARDFVTRDQAVQLRQARSIPPEADALGWVSSHLGELQSRYGGQWVGIAQGRVLASAATLQDLMAELGRVGARDPFITQIPAGEIVWHTTYVG